MQGRGVIEGLLQAEKENLADTASTREMDDIFAILTDHEKICVIKKEISERMRDNDLSVVLWKEEAVELAARARSLATFMENLTERRNRVVSYLQKTKSYGEIRVEYEYQRDLCEALPLLADGIAKFEECSEVLKDFANSELDLENIKFLHKKAEEQIARMNRHLEQLLLLNQSFDNIYSNIPQSPPE